MSKDIGQLVLATLHVDGTYVALIKTVFASILEVFVVCIAGFILATRGVLDSQTRKQLNRVNVSLFTPCLLFSKVAFNLTPSKLRELWIIPVIFCIVTVASMAVAWVVAHIFRLKRSQRNFAIAAAMFPNTNSLPIALMQSLAVTVPGLRWDENDNKGAMVGRALTYLVLHSTLGMILRWSYGVQLLASADPEEHPPQPVEADGPRTLATQQPSLGVTVRPPKPAPPKRSTTSASLISHNPDNYFNFPYGATPGASRITLVEASDEEDPLTDEPQSIEDGLPQVNGRQEGTEPSHSRWQSRLRRFKNSVFGFLKGVNDFMTAPLWAAVASLVVACTPPVQHYLAEHAQPIRGSITSAGQCSIPVTMIVLGAYFFRDEPIESKDKKPRGRGAAPKNPTLVQRVKAWWNKPQAKPEPAAKGETNTIIVSILSRMVLTPAVLLPLFYIVARYDLHEMFDDPVFVVANVLVVSSPPAITLAQMTQQASGDAFERLISRTIFWAYLVCTPPLTILYVVLGLSLSKQ
ncbi:auxin efflux carrier [Auriculariales sp. MPI-PUGE-AT-0066]|nr:auxin efflux carrier [Auriculariales sp. MPI-PUGE-AT-0066]